MDVDILSWLDTSESAKPAFKAKSRKDTLTASNEVSISFEINREVLLSLLEKAVTVVPTKDLIPVLTNFQFIATEDELTVVSSSGQMSIVQTTDQAKVNTPGIQVFPARTLLAIVKQAYNNSTVFVEVTNTGAVIVSGSYTAEISISSGEDFPKLEGISEVVFHEVPRKAFVDAISTVKYALPGREFSGQASMCMISIRAGKFTACDGARFQQVRIPEFRLSMQLPAFSINTIIKILSSVDMEILEIGETFNCLVFRLGSTVFYLNKMDSPYPNVEQLWLRPALNNDQELIVDKAQLITAINQVRVTADPTFNAIGLAIEDNQITVTSKNGDNSTKAVIECKWDKKPRNIVVNYAHLAEMLRAYGPSECRFLLDEDSKTHKAPILLKDDDTMALATIAQMLSYRAGL